MYISGLNSILKSLQKNHPGKLFYYPTKISIETGNICNLSCPLCPTGEGAEPGVRKGMMTFSDFKTVFDKISQFAKTVDLFNWGEPFLNKEIGLMVKYAKEKKPSLRILIDSNFNVVNDDQIDAIARHGLDVLKVSADGASQEIYEKYRRGGNLEAVRGNIEKLLQKKNELKTATPRVIWKYIVFKHNESEVETARRMAAKMGIDFEASGMRIDCGKEIFENIETSVSRDKEWIPDSPEYNNYKDLSRGTARRAPTSCGKPWKTLTIDWNGNVVPCGAIYNADRYSFGNLLKQSFSDVWNGEKFTLARRIIAGKSNESGVVCRMCKENGYQFF